jgi:hypothetical protein
VDNHSRDESLGKFEQTDRPDDYRHRMTMNALALVATVLLIVIGVWIADTISRMQKDQDCYLSGQRNCTTIDAPPMQRG